jgi:hypothetical protein
MLLKSSTNSSELPQVGDRNAVLSADKQCVCIGDLHLVRVNFTVVSRIAPNNPCKPCSYRVQVTYGCTPASGKAADDLHGRFRDHPTPEQLLQQRAVYDDSGAVGEQCGAAADVISHPVFFSSR